MPSNHGIFIIDADGYVPGTFFCGYYQNREYQRAGVGYAIKQECRDAGFGRFARDLCAA